MILKELVNEYIRYYNGFLTEDLVSLFSEDCLFQNVTNSAGIVECSGKLELRSMDSQSRELFKTRKQTVKNWIVEGSQVVIETEFSAVMACDLPNGIKEDDLLQLRGVSVFLFENGKIKRLSDYS